MNISSYGDLNGDGMLKSSEHEKLDEIQIIDSPICMMVLKLD